VLAEAPTIEGDYLGIVSDAWLEETLLEQQLLTSNLLHHFGPEKGVPQIDLITTLDSAANLSYGRKAEKWGHEVGVRVVPHFFGDDFEAAGSIEYELGPHNDVDHMLAFLPSWTWEGQLAIRHAMPAHKDVDGVTLRQKVPRLVPATAEAMQISAERIAGRQLQEMGRIGVIGYGERTLKPLVERIMRDRQIKPAVLLQSKDEIKALQRGKFVDEIKACDTVFTAVPVGGLLTAERVRPGQIIIDVGYGIHPETEEACGNVDPSVFTLGGLVKATAFRRGVGPITVAITVGRAIDARMEKLGIDKPTALALAA